MAVFSQSAITHFAIAKHLLHHTKHMLHPRTDCRFLAVIRKHRLEADNIRLTERLALSHDLHDSLGSSLIRSIALTERSTTALSRQHFLSMLKELRDYLRQIIDNSSSRSSSDNITPAEWIAPLRHRFVRLFDELSLQSEWQLPPQWPHHLTAIQLVTLTRFLEEALSNAIKHSQASHISITLDSRETGGLMLQVTDNGQGFDTHAASTGIGMYSMRARIQRIGGQLDIQSQAGKTQLRVYLNSA